MHKTAVLLAALVAAGVPRPAEAHPHVLVDARSTVVFEAGQIVAIDHEWTFDEGFSVYATQGLDTNGDGVYSREELAELAEVNVTSLADFAFFTYLAPSADPLSADDFESVAFGAPEGQYLTYSNNRATLHYRLPLTAPLAIPQGGAAILDIFDYEYFVAFTLAGDDPIRLAGAPLGCKVTLDQPQEMDAAFAAILSMIPTDGALNKEQQAVTSGLANRARVTCAS